MKRGCYTSLFCFIEIVSSQKQEGEELFKLLTDKQFNNILFDIILIIGFYREFPASYAG